MYYMNVNVGSRVPGNESWIRLCFECVCVWSVMYVHECFLIRVCVQWRASVVEGISSVNRTSESDDGIITYTHRAIHPLTHTNDLVKDLLGFSPLHWYAHLLIYLHWQWMRMREWMRVKEEGTIRFKMQCSQCTKEIVKGRGHLTVKEIC